MENSFLEFRILGDWSCEGVAMPIKKGLLFRTLAMDYSFFCGVIAVDGTLLTDEGCDLVFENGDFTIYTPTLDSLNIGDCFRFRVVRGQVFYFSQIFRVVPDDDETCKIEYWCDENTFGFPYEENGFRNSVFLPLMLHSVQYPQKEKIYQKSNGEQVVLYAKIEEEWKLETEYIPLEWHRKLIMALSHDHVRINGKEVAKKEGYKIDYNNEIVSECGEKLYKGSCVVRGNSVERNSNC